MGTIRNAGIAELMAEGSWLADMLMRKPRMLISMAQANKTARIVWAVLMTKQDYRASVVSG